MTSPCGRYTLIYNGEIYNHLDLRADLLKEGGFTGTPIWWGPRLPNNRPIANGTELVVQCGAIEKRNGKYRVKNQRLWHAICEGLRQENPVKDKK